MSWDRPMKCLLASMIIVGAALGQAAIAQSLEGTSPDPGAIRRGSKETISSRNSPIGQKIDISSSEAAIREGTEAPLYNYVVGISFLRNGASALCTGTLVGEKLVLTAAHCGCGTNYSVTQE